MQRSMDAFARACDNFGLTISTKKTEVLHQPPPNVPYVKPDISVNGQRLAAVDKFVYLGSTLSRSANIDDEVAYRVARASAAFGRLKENVWGAARTLHWNQVESLQSRCSAIPTVCM